MPKRWRALALAALCTTGLTAAPGGPAGSTAGAAAKSGLAPAGGASNTPRPGDPEPGQNEQEALAHDLSVIAEGSGWTMDEAWAYHRSAEAVGAVAKRLAAENPGAFVGSAVSTDPRGAPTIYVKGRADSAVKAWVAAAGVPIVIADHQPFNVDELRARRRQVHDSLKAQGFVGVGSGVRPDGGGRITATVQRRAGLPGDPAAIVSRLPEAVRGAVVVNVSDAPVARPKSAYGGLEARNTNDEELTCTTGWSAYRIASGTTGTTTAAHCSAGINRIYDPIGGTTTWSYFTREEGFYGDVQWGTSPTWEPAQFIYDATSTPRRVTALEVRSEIKYQERVCLFGQGSNRAWCDGLVEHVDAGCDYVNNSGVSISLDNMIRMDREVGLDFDSGGPWYVGAKAYGSEFGFCNGGEMWTIADLYDEGLGVKVRLAQTMGTRMYFYAGDKLVSSDGRFTAIMQDDGNFVLYWNGHYALWSTGTSGNPGARVVMGADGNLVVKRADGTAIWDTNTAGTNYSLTLQSDGNLVMRTSSGAAVWASNTCCH